MQVQVLVTVDVDPCDPKDNTGSTGEFQAAAVEAITNAVKFGEAEGFSHTLADYVSIGVVAIEHYEGREG